MDNQLNLLWLSKGKIVANKYSLILLKMWSNNNQSAENRSNIFMFSVKQKKNDSIYKALFSKVVN